MRALWRRDPRPEVKLSTSEQDSVLEYKSGFSLSFYSFTLTLSNAQNDRLE